MLKVLLTAVASTKFRGMRDKNVVIFYFNSGNKLFESNCLLMYLAIYALGNGGGFFG